MKGNQKLSITAPALPPERDALVPDQFELESESDYTSLSLRDLDLTGRELSESVFDSTRFARVTLNDTTLDKCQFRDTRFDTCSMANAAWKSCKLGQLQLANCKFTGLRLIEAQLANVLFDNCAGKFAHFNGSVFRKVIFQNCSLPGADFSNCNFQDTMFIGCDLSEALFYDAKLQGTDFRGSTIFGMKAFAKDLSGAIMSEEQVQELAPMMAELLGISLPGD
jgi:fluoroquinolone resistance protein